MGDGEPHAGAFLPPRVSAVDISDEKGRLQADFWIDPLLRLGWVAGNAYGSGFRLIVVVCMPCRRGAAIWAALGAACAAVQFCDQRLSWERLREAPPGTKYAVRVRSKSGKPIALTIEIIETGQLPRFDGRWAVRFRVIKGPKNYGGNAVLTWDWPMYRDRVLPVGASLKHPADRSLRDGAAIIGAMAGVPAKSWLYQDQKSVAVIGDRTAVRHDSRQLTLSTSSGDSATLAPFFDGTFPQIATLPVRGEAPPSSVPALILNGPEALEHLRRGPGSSAIVLLNWSELDHSTRNTLGPWLDANDADQIEPRLDGIQAPESWQIVVSAIRTDGGVA